MTRPENELPMQPGGAEPEFEGMKPRVGPVRRLYDWVLHWADTPYGTPALGALSFAESSVFPIPPDPLLMALSLGKPKRALHFAAICTLASVLGGLAGYAIGAVFWQAAGDFFFTAVPGVTPEAFATVQSYYERWDFWAIFLAGLTPLPYKVFTLSAGVFSLNLGVFVVASFVSRGLRFFIEAALIWKWGEPMARFIDRYFDALAIAFGVLLIGGFAAIRWLLH